MDVREALPSEHAELGELCVRAYRATGSVSDRYAAALRDVAGRAQTARIFVAVDGAEPLGCVALVRACVEEIRHVGRTRVVISSASDMVAAHRLYERLGFTRAPERDWRPIPEVQLRVYELALEST